MKEHDIPLKKQCDYCQKSLNTTHCREMKPRINEEYNFKCPYFVFDDYLYDEDYKKGPKKS